MIISWGLVKQHKPHSDDRFTITTGRAQDLLSPDNGFFSSIREQVYAFLMDPPWQIIPDDPADVMLPDDDIDFLVRRMYASFGTNDHGVIGVRVDTSPVQAAVWFNAMKRQNMHVSVVRISDSVASSNSRCSSNMRRPRNTTNGHQWIIGTKQYRCFHPNAAWSKCSICF
jgi:hypothetical protein